MPKTAARKAAGKAPPATKDRSGAAGFGADEKAAARDRMNEIRAARRPPRTPEEALADVRAKIASMPEPDRTLAKRPTS